MSTDATDALFNATFAFYSLGDNVDALQAEDNAPNARTIPILLLKTFALRLAVICAYGHLRSLQGLSKPWHAAGPRMILLGVCPCATFISFIGAYLLGLMDLTRNPTLWHFSLAVATQPHRTSPRWTSEPTLRINGIVNTSGIEYTTGSEVINLADVPYEWHDEVWIKRKTLPDAWCWYSFLLSIAQALLILAVLAQAVASIVLVVRRAQVPGATLLLDSTNGLYAVIRILTAGNSLAIMVVGDKWEIMLDAPLQKLNGKEEKGFVRAMAVGIVFGMSPMSYLKGQRLLSMNDDCGVGPRGKLRMRLSCSNPPLPTFIANILILLAMIGWVCIKALPPLYKGWNTSSRKIYDVLGFLLKTLGVCCLGIVVANYFSYWVVQIYELDVIAYSF